MLYTDGCVQCFTEGWEGSSEMSRGLLHSDCTHFEVGFLKADDPPSDVARDLTNGHAVAVPTAESTYMPAAAELAPTSAHRAGLECAQITPAESPKYAWKAGATGNRTRAGPCTSGLRGTLSAFVDWRLRRR